MRLMRLIRSLKKGGFLANLPEMVILFSCWRFILSVALIVFSDFALYIILPRAKKPEKRGGLLSKSKGGIIYLKACRLKRISLCHRASMLKSKVYFLNPRIKAFFALKYPILIGNPCAKKGKL
jgi:hypothetical protein